MASVFGVSETLRIVAGRIAGTGTPYLVLYQGYSSGGIVIYPDEVRELINQLVEATVSLIDGVDDGL